MTANLAMRSEAGAAKLGGMAAVHQRTKDRKARLVGGGGSQPTNQPTDYDQWHAGVARFTAEEAKQEVITVMRLMLREGFSPECVMRALTNYGHPYERDRYEFDGHGHEPCIVQVRANMGDLWTARNHLKAEDNTSYSDEWERGGTLRPPRTPTTREWRY